jgi:ABC-2 type transport system ATP-binding protein
MSILKVQGLRKSFRRGFIPKTTEVLKGLNFELIEGRITGFLGGNGAGKTTTMKCLLGLALPDEGRVEYFGGRPLDSQTKARIGFLPEHPYFYDYLTGEEFLRFYGQVSGVGTKSLKERMNSLLKKVDLVHAKDRPLRNYSKGMLQKIGIAQALIHNPDLVILDEPMSGLDPDGRFYLAEIIKETAKEGKSVFFSSHLLNDAERLCEDLVVLKNGQVIYQGRMDKMLENVSAKTEVVFDQSGRRQTQTLESLPATQNFIDKIRREGGNILSVHTQRMTLEEAFIKIALRGESA